MSGRGRGRGGRGPLSGGRALLQRSAKEAGLGASSFKTLEDITRPALFPDYEWHSNGGMQVIRHPLTESGEGDLSKAPVVASSHHKPKQPRKASTNVYLINKGRELQERFQQSAYYLQVAQEVDVLRYSTIMSAEQQIGGGHKRKRESPDHAVVDGVLEYSGMNNIADKEEYLPKELWTSTKDSVGGGSAGAVILARLDALASAESGANPSATEDADENPEDDDDNAENAEEEEEEDADYATNYYASDDDNDDGGDDEAVF